MRQARFIPACQGPSGPVGTTTGRRLYHGAATGSTETAGMTAQPGTPRSRPRKVTRPAWLPGAVRGAGAALLVVAASAAVPVIELLIFRRFGSRPVPGPYEARRDDERWLWKFGSVRWVWLGDSLSAGVGADFADESFPRLTAALVAARLRTDVELTCSRRTRGRRR